MSGSTRPPATSLKRPGADREGPRQLVVSSDFYSGYASAGRKARGLVNLYCWAHVRRHFVPAGDANPDQLSHWTAAWLERIKNLYTAHERLSTAWAGGAAAELEHARTAGDDALGLIDAQRTRQMAAPGLQTPAQKALATLEREWDGPAAHRDYPMISLDNNPAERAPRRPVGTRKNAYGSRNQDPARLAARIWTVTATAEMARAERHHLPHRLPRRLRTNRRQAAGRPGPRTVPTLERDPRRPGRLGTAAPPRLTPPPAPPRRHRSETVTPLPDMPARHFRTLTPWVFEGSAGGADVRLGHRAGFGAQRGPARRSAGALRGARVDAAHTGAKAPSGVVAEKAQAGAGHPPRQPTPAAQPLARSPATSGKS